MTQFPPEGYTVISDIMDVLDGPDQEIVTSELINTIDLTRRPAPHIQDWKYRPDLPTNPAYEDDMHVTDPSHGGKVVCHKCNGFMTYGEAEGYLDHQHKDEFPKAWFHKRCYNQYEHYYGLDKPID